MKKKKLKRKCQGLRENNAFLCEEIDALGLELGAAHRRVSASALAMASATATLADISRVLGARPGETALEAAKALVAHAKVTDATRDGAAVSINTPSEAKPYPEVPESVV